MDKQAVLNALDKAISETVIEEFERVTVGKSDSYGQWLRNNSRDEIFRSLRSSTSPNYSNPMVAVVYAAMYQLQHVNLTYSLIKDMLAYGDSERAAFTNCGRLQLIDFGAGCLAMQFGITLALADSLEQGQESTFIHVDSMDPSAPMLSLGEKIWKNFINVLAESRENPSSTLNFLNQTIPLISYGLHKDIYTIEVVKESDRWISAIHAFYPTFEGKVRDALAELYQRIQPVAGLLSCYGNHSGKGSVPLVNRISPFEPNRFVRRILNGQGLEEQFTHTIHSNPETALVNRNWGLIENYPATRRTIRAVLNWDYDTAFFTYTLGVPEQVPHIRDIRPSEPPVIGERVRQYYANPREARELASTPTESSAVYQGQMRQTLSSPKPDTFSVGDRVNVPSLGNGRVTQIRGTKALVLLDRGIPCTVPADELRRL